MYSASTFSAGHPSEPVSEIQQLYIYIYYIVIIFRLYRLPKRLCEFNMYIGRRYIGTH